MKSVIEIFRDLFHIHDWYRGDFSLGYRSKYTHDFISRCERHCLTCGCRELSLSQLSVDSRVEVFKALGKKEWYAFEENDWLDKYTKLRLLQNVTDYTLDKGATGMIMLPHIAGR